MSDPRIACLMTFRVGCLVAPLLVGTVATRLAGAQQPATDVLSGSITFMQPLTRRSPGDLVQRLVLDPSPHAFAPWAAVGVRWQWNAAPDRSAHAMGAVGLRFRRRSLRVALGLGRDAVYGRVLRHGNSDGNASPPPSLPSLPIFPSGECPDSLVPDRDKGCVPPERPGYVMQSVSDVTGSVEWGIGRLTVGLGTGWRLAGPASQRLWYSATAVTPLAPMFALVAGVDHRHDRVFLPSATRLTLGLQWRWALRRHRPSAEAPRASTDAAASPRLSPLGKGNLVVHRLPSGIRLSLVAAGAHQVEVRSDLTGWTAVPMERSADGKWQLDLAAGPGIHRLAVRVDGGPWLPPPELPAGSDGYGGAVGLFVVES